MVFRSVWHLASLSTPHFSKQTHIWLWEHLVYYSHFSAGCLLFVLEILQNIIRGLQCNSC